MISEFEHMQATPPPWPTSASFSSEVTIESRLDAAHLQCFGGGTGGTGGTPITEIFVEACIGLIPAQTSCLCSTPATAHITGAPHILQQTGCVRDQINKPLELLLLTCR